MPTLRRLIVPAAVIEIVLLTPSSTLSGMARAGVASPRATVPGAGSSAPNVNLIVGPGALISEMTRSESAPSQRRDDGHVSADRATPATDPNRSEPSP